MCMHSALQVVSVPDLQPQPSLPRGIPGAHCQVHINPNASALAAAYSDSPTKRSRPPPLNQRMIFEVCSESAPTPLLLLLFFPLVL